MGQWPADYAHCFSEELVEVLILAPEELDKEDRAYLIAHLAVCSSCQQVAGVLARFYAEVFSSEVNDQDRDVPPASDVSPASSA